jgi:hypothetical protein
LMKSDVPRIALRAAEAVVKLKMCTIRHRASARKRREAMAKWLERHERAGDSRVAGASPTLCPGAGQDQGVEDSAPATRTPHTHNPPAQPATQNRLTGAGSVPALELQLLEEEHPAVAAGSVVV